MDSIILASNPHIRSMAEAEMIEGVKRSTLAELTDRTAMADKVLVF